MDVEVMLTLLFFAFFAIIFVSHSKNASMTDEEKEAARKDTSSMIDDDTFREVGPVARTGYDNDHRL